MTLSQYQWQLGNIVFGNNTQIPVSKVDIQPYNVNNQDFQVQRSDENRFGVDTLSPSPIVFTMSVMNNHQLDSMVGFSSAPFPNTIFAGDNTLLHKLAAEWKNPPVRLSWGKTVPLLFCDKSEQIRRIYGRPGKFAHSPRNKGGEVWVDVQAEFRRADTLAYSDIEYFVGHPTDPTKGLPPTGVNVAAQRIDGDADSWLRILLYGPMTHPIINYGSQVLELSTHIDPGMVLEISSYPWERRVVDNLNINHRTEVIGSTLYLDQIKFAHDGDISINWSCSDSNVDTQLFFLWREAYNVV